MPTLADRLNWIFDELHALDCAPSNDAFVSRASSLRQQVYDAIAVLAERGWIKYENLTARS